jgi:hypothetical protein
LVSDNIIALVVLQDLADSKKVPSVCSEICGESSRDAYQAVSIKAKVLSDAEEENYPVPIIFPGIEAKPEVSCVSVRWSLQIQVSLVYKLHFSEQFAFIKVPFPPKSRKLYTHHGAGGEKQTLPTSISHHPSPYPCLVLIIQIT